MTSRRRRRHTVAATLHDAAADLLAVLVLESRLGSVLLEKAELLGVDGASSLPASSHTSTSSSMRLTRAT